MSYELNTEKAIKVFTRLSTKLRSAYGDKIKITLGDMEFNKRRQGHYITIERLINGNAYCIDWSNCRTEKVITEVAKLFEPTFVQATSICVDAIGKTLHLDKKEPVVVEALTKKGVVLDDGRTVQADSLWLEV